jgi:catechol 2,3-dioxygenase-like lactoylglutathione lyase family enzyme
MGILRPAWRPCRQQSGKQRTGRALGLLIWAKTAGLSSLTRFGVLAGLGGKRRKSAARRMAGCGTGPEPPIVLAATTLETGPMAIKQMHNVGIVVDDLEATIDFFREVGLELEGRATIEGEWAGRVTGLGDQQVEIAMMRTPDGHGRLELSRFLKPSVVADHRNTPVNAVGYLRVMFAVDNLDETLDRLGKRGASLVGEVVQYKHAYRLCYIRGPGGLLIGLAEELD